MSQLIINHPRRLLIFLGILLALFMFFYFINVKAGPTFDSCAEIHAAGRSSIPKGDPLYKPSLDRDKDDLACE